VISSTLRRATFVAGIAVLVSTSFAAPSFAASNDRSSSQTPLGLVPYTGPAPEGLEFVESPAQPGEMSKSVSDGIWNLELSVPEVSVNTYEWSADDQTLLIYSAEGDEYWSPLLDKFFPGERVEIVPAKHSKADIDHVLDTIVASGGVLANGARVVTAEPEKDGSSIAIGVERSAAARSSVSEQSVAAKLDTDIPLSIEAAPSVEAADRNAPGSQTIWVAGNAMSSPSSTPGRINLCSTGFDIARLSNDEPGMLSAEHCGRGKPSTAWTYSKYAPTAANSLGSFQGTLSSGTANSDTALWTGGNVAKMYPAVYVGPYTNATSADRVRGGNYPAVNTDVCYSGSQSGNVCDNKVVNQGLTICYAIGQCYQGLTRTEQRNGIPAVGNGDSGGPVYQIVNGRLNASGVVSGIINGSNTCTGEPGVSGGRQCSTNALFAPVIAALGSGGSWGLSYIP